MRFSYEVTHPESPKDIEPVWPTVVEIMTRELAGVDAAAAYTAKAARDAGEHHDAALANAWEAAERAVYLEVFVNWHRTPQTLIISAT